VRVPLGQDLVDGRHDQPVAQDLVGVLHPGFVQILDLFGDQSVAKAALRPAGFNHAAPPPRSGDCQAR